MYCSTRLRTFRGDTVRARLTGRMEGQMEESTALWLLELAHAECEALQNEIDSVRETCRERYESELALRRERDALRAERDALKAAIHAARAAGWHDFPGLTDHSAGDP